MRERGTRRGVLRAVRLGAIVGAVLDLVVVAYLLLGPDLQEGEAADYVAVLVMVTFGAPLVGALLYLRSAPNAGYLGVVVGALLVVLVAGALIG